MAAQAQALLALGCQAVLLKGGHGSGEEAVDILCDATGIERFVRPRVDTRNTHGTGCTLSAAITALLAQGVGLREAVGRAKAFVWQALQEGRALGIGHGNGPVDHLFAIRRCSAADLTVISAKPAQPAGAEITPVSASIGEWCGVRLHGHDVGGRVTRLVANAAGSANCICRTSTILQDGISARVWGTIA